MRNNPNMQRYNRGTMPASQRVHMGVPLTPPVAQVASSPVPVTEDPAQKALLHKQEEQIQALQLELGKARAVLQQLGPPDTAPDTLLQNLKSQSIAFTDLQSKLLQQTEEVGLLQKKVNDLEAERTTAGKVLDTPPPLDKVYVTTVQSRAVENGNVVVTCTMHTGLESDTVTGTLLIPQSEFGKLRPPKQSQ